MLVTPFELASIGVGGAALFLALVVARATLIQSRAAVAQSKRASAALALQQEVARADAVMHFTNRYFDLLNRGNPADMISDAGYDFEFWSLHATEFYFFHHGVLPEFMYSLWMIDLADLYAADHDKAIRQSHKNYLQAYAFGYPKMVRFYDELHRVAVPGSPQSAQERNHAVVGVVAAWINKHRTHV